MEFPPHLAEAEEETGTSGFSGGNRIKAPPARRNRPAARGAARMVDSTYAAITRATPRPRIDGKFFALGNERLRLNGVTYGTFAPDADGVRFGRPEYVEADFTQMAKAGINAVRTY